MALPHFPVPGNLSSKPYILHSSFYDIKFYTALGVELDMIHTNSVKIEETHNSSSIKASIYSTEECVADYKTLSKIKYCYFRVHNRKHASIKEIIYKVTLIGVQRKFEYSMDTSLQENDCDFMVNESHDIMSKNMSVDNAIRTIIRGTKIDDILE